MLLTRAFGVTILTLLCITGGVAFVRSYAQHNRDISAQFKRDLVGKWKIKPAAIRGRIAENCTISFDNKGNTETFCDGEIYSNDHYFSRIRGKYEASDGSIDFIDVRIVAKSVDLGADMNSSSYSVRIDAINKDRLSVLYSESKVTIPVTTWTGTEETVDTLPSHTDIWERINNNQ